MSEPCPHGLYAGCDHCVRLTLKHIEELEEVNIDLSDQLEREQIEHRREVMAHVETQRKLQAAQKYIKVVEPEYNELTVILADLCDKRLLSPCVVCGGNGSHAPDCGLGKADAFFGRLTKSEPSR